MTGPPQASALSPERYEKKSDIQKPTYTKPTPQRRQNKTSSAKYFQQGIEEVQKWGKKWKIGINAR